MRLEVRQARSLRALVAQLGAAKAAPRVAAASRMPAPKSETLGAWRGLREPPSQHVQHVQHGRPSNWFSASFGIGRWFGGS